MGDVTSIHPSSPGTALGRMSQSEARETCAKLTESIDELWALLRAAHPRVVSLEAAAEQGDESASVTGFWEIQLLLKNAQRVMSRVREDFSDLCFLTDLYGGRDDAPTTTARTEAP